MVRVSYSLAGDDVYNVPFKARYGVANSLPLAIILEEDHRAPLNGIGHSDFNLLLMSDRQEYPDSRNNPM
jgi:hypothetical protein